MLYGIPRFCRWLRFCACLVSFTGSLIAITATQNGPPIAGKTYVSTATVTAAYNSTTQIVTVTYNLSANSTGEICNAACYTPFETISVTTIAQGLKTNNGSVNYTLAQCRAAGLTDTFSFGAGASGQGPSGAFNPNTTAGGSITLPWDYYCVSWTIWNGEGNNPTVYNPADGDDYRMLQNDTVIASTTVSWGELKQFRKDGLITNAPVTLQKGQAYVDYVFDPTSGVWKKQPLEITWWATVETRTPSYNCSSGDGSFPENFVPDKINQPAPGTYPAGTTGSISGPASPSNPAGTSPKEPTNKDGTKSTGTIWNTNINTTGSGGVDEETFTEGIGKLEKQLESVNSKLDKGSQNDDSVAAAASSGAASTSNGNGTGGGTAKQQAQGAFNDAKDAPAISLPSRSQNWNVDFPGVGNVSLDPADIPGIPQAANITKQIIIWATSIAFAWFCWGEFSQVVTQLLAAKQAQGNAVIGGTGAQATALIAAAAITAIIIAVPLAFWGFATYSITPVTDTSEPADAALYLLFFFFPVAHVLGLTAATFLIRKSAIVLVAGTATLIRFVVP